MSEASEWSEFVNTDDDGNSYVVVARDEVILDGASVLRIFWQQIAGERWRIGDIYVLYIGPDMMWQENENGYLATWDHLRQEWVAHEPPPASPCRSRPELRVIH